MARRFIVCHDWTLRPIAWFYNLPDALATARSLRLHSIYCFVEIHS